MVRVRVPATTANMGPGYDTLGMALNLNNYVEIVAGQKIADNPADKQIISEINIRNKSLQIDLKKEDDLVRQTLKLLSQYTGVELSGVKIKESLIARPAQGLGSSAAAIVGTLLAANEFFQLNLARQELRLLACRLEGHPDNVIAAMEGGLTVSTFSPAEEVLIWEKVKPHKKFKAVIVIPELTSITEVQRSAVPDRFGKEDMIFNLGRTALLSLAIRSGNEEKIGKLMKDRIHQPYRCSNIPGWEDVVEAGYRAGALGIALSGAGPSIFALTRGSSESVGEAMVNVWREIDISADYFLTSPDNRGSYIEEE